MECRDSPGVLASAGEVDLRVTRPGTGETLEVSGTVAWPTEDASGVHFHYIPENQRQALAPWLTSCVERSLVELCERVRATCAS
jgi:hypothetical protein